MCYPSKFSVLEVLVKYIYDDHYVYVLFRPNQPNCLIIFLYKIQKGFNYSIHSMVMSYLESVWIQFILLKTENTVTK